MPNSENAQRQTEDEEQAPAQRTNLRFAQKVAQDMFDGAFVM
jgi:hypothetical protein